MEMLCVFCVDEHCAGQITLDKVEKAVTLVPHVQAFGIGGQQMASLVAVPSCVMHRKRQVATTPKSNLVQASVVG
jgi:hypothetical protein